MLPFWVVGTMFVCGAVLLLFQIEKQRWTVELFRKMNDSHRKLALYWETRNVLYAQQALTDFKNAEELIAKTHRESPLREDFEALELQIKKIRKILTKS